MAQLPTMQNGIAQVRAPQERSLPIPRVDTPHLITPQLETPRQDIPRLATPQLAELPSSLRDAASFLDKAGKEATEVAKVMAREEGVKAVMLDEDGNVVVDRAPIIGEAAITYQRAIETAAITKSDIAARDRLLKMREEQQDDPEAFRVAAAEFRNERVKQINESVGPVAALSVGNSIDSTAVEIYRSLQRKKQDRDLRDARETIDADIERTKNELFALVQGGMDPSAPEYQARMNKIGVLWGELAKNPRFGVSRQRVETEMGLLQSEMTVASMGRRIDEIQKRDGPEAAVKTAESVLTDTSLQLTPAQRLQYHSRLVQGIQQRVRLQDSADRAIDTDITSIVNQASSGGGVSPEKLAQTQQKVDASGNKELIERFDAVKTVLPIVQDWQRLSPAQLDERLMQLDELRRKGSSRDMDALAIVGDKLRTKMRGEITKDPLTWADRSGALTVPAIDFAAKNAAEQMRDRVGKAETVAQTYGTTPTYLKAAERDILTGIASKGGDNMLAVAKTIVEGFGDRAPRVLAEIGKDAPVLAHLGGLALSGASPSFLRDAAQGVAYEQNTDFKHPRWVETGGGSDAIKAAQQERIVEQYGNAFVMQPDTGRAANETAKKAFFARTANAAYDPKLVDGASKQIYDDTLQLAAGATFAGKVRYGGVDEYSRTGWYGYRTINRVMIPANVRSGYFGTVIGALRDEDIAGPPAGEFDTGRPVGADGKPFRASDLKNAIPVAVRGGYSFAFGDPSSDDPKWVLAPGGQRFVLDIERLEPVLRKRVHEAYAPVR